jgi:hypothetical protein
VSRLRFLLDEHLAHAIQSQLLRLDGEIEILVLGQPSAPQIGASDQDILLWLERTGYALVTNNRRTMPDHIRAHYAAGHRLPGLFLLKRQARIGQVIEQIYLLWAASEAEEYMDRVLYLPL